MARGCLRFSGFMVSCLGWVGIIIATATSDWVHTCKYDMHTCRRMDELRTRGLWVDCVISTALYHCVALNQILALPGRVEPPAYCKQITALREIQRQKNAQFLLKLLISSSVSIKVFILYSLQLETSHDTWELPMIYIQNGIK